MSPSMLNIKITKFPEGIMAQCLDKPEILVTGKNKKEIQANLKKIITGYVEAFPETKKEFVSADNKMLEVKFVEY